MKLFLFFVFFIYFYEINTAALDIKSKINNVLTKVNDVKSSLSTDKFLTYLTNFGYVLDEKIQLKNGLFASSLTDPASKLKKALSQFQQMHHLPVTGVLDNATEKKMQSPRCGLPDINHDSNKNSIIAQYKTAGKWSKNALTYKILNKNAELKDGTRQAVASAFNYWAEQTPLTFQEVCSTCNSDLTIDFAYRDHRDGFPFDGPGGVLAHAFFPMDGRIHFDEDELFTESTNSGTNLRIVAAHEFGHALGLEHSFVQGALMYPYYAGYDPNFKLHSDDIQGIQSIYGPRKNPPNTTPTTRPTTKAVVTQKTSLTTKPTTKSVITTTTKSPSKDNLKPCKLHNDAIFLGPDRNIFVIVDRDFLWKYYIKEKQWGQYNLEKTYPGLMPGSVGGVLDRNNITWFFKARKIWAYSGYNLVKGFPKVVDYPFYPRHPFTAIVKGNKMFLIRSKHAFEFDTDTLRVVGYFGIDYILPGFDQYIDTAFQHTDGFYYFFQQDYHKVYKYDSRRNKTEPGYPKKTSEGWFPCV